MSPTRLLMHGDRPSTIVVTLCAGLAIVSAIALVVIHFVYTPLQVDGAWYGYPAYALAHDRDPAENLAAPESLESQAGTKISFGFETRHLRVLPMAAWFSAFGSSIWSAKVYSVLELLLLLSGFAYALAASRMTPWVAGLVWLFAISDIVPLTLGSTDLRPDLAIAFLALTLAAVTVFHRGPFSVYRIVLAAVLSFALVGTHLTSAIAFSILGGTMVIDVVTNRRGREFQRLAAYAVTLAVGLLGLIFNRFVYETTIPSAVERPEGVYSPDVLPSFDLVATLTKELRRWQDYFFDANLAVMVGLLLAIVLAALLLFGRHRGSRRHEMLLPLCTGVLCGVATLGLFNPHITSSHAMTVVLFAFVLLGIVIDQLRAPGRAWIPLSLCGLVVAASLAKIALSGKILLLGRGAGLSNAAVAELVQSALGDPAVDIAIGPAKLWAYTDPDKNVLILDIRANELARFADLAPRVDRIFIDADYASFRFLENFERYFPELTVTLDAEVGDTGSIDFLQVYSARRRF